ncbi:MAG: type IIA DNA topoisomerase subunit B [Bacteroidales bacterium]|jgi:topoisomerase-4 subunit B|nr:type IIA DNA topoisomerase subunit B [Bacteroidales bacterium]
MATEEVNNLLVTNDPNYNDDSVKTLAWNQHIRHRSGMYIGKLGDGATQDDGIYILLKEVLDNSVDEFMMGCGKAINLDIDESGTVTVRDFGRGIPLGSLKDCVSKINTGAKYDSGAFKRSVGLNGVGLKAVNALSSFFRAESVRNGEKKIVEFSKGELVFESGLEYSEEKNGTKIIFTPDNDLFTNYHFIEEYIDKLLWNYCYLNIGLTINYNGEKYLSKNGLLDLLAQNITESEMEYPIVHFYDDDIDVAFTHRNSSYSEEYFSFANSQYTPHGGTHVAALKEAFVKTVKDFYKKDFDPQDVRHSLIVALSIKITEPNFEGQTKTKLGSLLMEPDGRSIRTFINDFIKRNLDNYLHKDKDVAESMLKRIVASEKERKEINEIKKISRETSKKASLNNKKLRDCRVHFNTNNERKLESTIFITEGLSASGSITKSRDVLTQAVFSLRGKPQNCYGKPKHIAYQNEEFNLLQSALNIENGLEGLRYNNVVIATDADVDGMHIRLLLLTFFLQFYPELVKSGHVYILQTPLFRVRNKKETRYCYTEEERIKAIKEVKDPEITRFKGLGEISPDEFGNLIGKNMRLDPVLLSTASQIPELLSFYMGENDKDRQIFIMENLREEAI